MEPTTLKDAIVYFANPANCREYVVARRWPDGVICPRCGSDNVAFQEKYNRWQCNKRHDRRQFTVKTGTIFEAGYGAMPRHVLSETAIVPARQPKNPRVYCTISAVS